MQNEIFDRTFFTKQHKQMLEKATSDVAYIQATCANVLFRTTTSTSPSSDMPVPPEIILDDVDTFVITASAEQENTITYVSPTNLVDLNVRDGGYF